MKYFRFRNWESYQHYHDRNPPWFKVYTKILDRGNDWYGMTDAQCGVLAKMLAWACRMGNTMPYNSEIVGDEIHASGTVDLALFENLGMIEVFATRDECAAVEQDRIASLGCASKSASKNASNRASKSAMLRERVREERSESEEDLEERIPPTPLAGGDAAAPRRTKAGIASQAQEVVKALNEITGRSFSLDRGNGAIEAVLRGGATVAECREVLAFCWAKWYLDPKMVKFVNKVTPFRKSHFDAYLDESRAGAAASNTKPKKAPEPEDEPDMTAEERQKSLDALRSVSNAARHLGWD